MQNFRTLAKNICERDKEKERSCKNGYPHYQKIFKYRNSLNPSRFFFSPFMLLIDKIWRFLESCYFRNSLKLDKYFLNCILWDTFFLTFLSNFRSMYPQ